MELLGNAIFSGILAGFVASGVSVGIEIFGGKVGGVLGSTPTTIIPAVAGVWLSITGNQLLDQTSVVNFQKSMFVVSTSMLINGGFLYCWKYFPAYLKAFALFDSKTEWLLAAVTLASYSFWLLTSFTFVYLYNNLIPVDFSNAEIIDGTNVSAWYIVTSASQSPAFILAVCSLSAHLILGIAGNFYARETPKSTKKQSWRNNLLRGLAAGLSIFIAVLLSSVNSVVGGVASTFPAIFGTAMISVWLTSGTAVSLGAVEPLFFGSLSVSIFSFISAFLIPILDKLMKREIALAVAIFIIYAFCVAFVSVPIYFYLQWRISKSVNKPFQTNGKEKTCQAYKSPLRIGNATTETWTCNKGNYWRWKLLVQSHI
jgi:hypothetical protein